MKTYLRFTNFSNFFTHLNKMFTLFCSRNTNKETLIYQIIYIYSYLVIHLYVFYTKTKQKIQTMRFCEMKQKYLFDFKIYFSYTCISPVIKYNAILIRISSRTDLYKQKLYSFSINTARVIPQINICVQPYEFKIIRRIPGVTM